MIESDAFYAALDEGLAALAAGTPLAQVTRDLTARYPAYAAELPELLAAAHAAGVNAPLAPPPSRAQARSRAAFLGRAAALRQPPRRRGWAILSLPLARAALTVLVFVAGFGAGTYGAVVVSADALPGEALYGIKRTVENTELLLTGDPQTRSALEAEFTTRRVEEVQQLTNAGRTAAVEFTGWLSAMDGERWVVAGLPVVVPAGTPISGTPRPEVWVRVAGVVQPDRTVRAERVAVLADAEVPLPTATPAASATPAPTHTPAPTATRAATATRAVGEDVEFTGVVQSMGAGAWLIGGQAVGVNAATDLRDNPQVGDTVEVRAVRQADGSLLATRIRVEDDGGADDGAAPSSTPGTDDGDDDDGDDDGGDDNTIGSSATNTPEPDDESDDSDDDDSSGSSATNTPEPDDDGEADDSDSDDSSGSSATNTPEPDDDSDDSDDDDNSGPSATNTPKPDEDDDSDDD